MLYVDRANIRGVVAIHLALWCRMTADTVNELHYWARTMRIPLRRFCPGKPEPYLVDPLGMTITRDTYLITTGEVDRAIAIMGAKLVESEKISDIPT